MSEYNYKLNTIQTPITEEVLSVLDTRSRSEFIECLDKIELLGNITKLSRGYAKDKPRDRKGRIIVDIENPHILTNMNYFRQAAIHFEQHNCYTTLYPNNNPNSEYKKFWDEEKRRCIEGYVRSSDGEWIPGYYYFYLNYCRIQKTEAIEGDRSERKEGFPDLWDGDYLFYHYAEQAEADGKHGNILKCRGRGYSYKMSSMAARNYFFVKGSKSFMFASETEYLTRDGILTKCWDNINFIDNNTPFTLPRDYKDTEMWKKASYKDPESKTEKGPKSEVIGVTCKDDADKGRGKRGKLLVFEESGSFPGLGQVWAIARKSVEQGRQVFGFLLATGTGGEEGSNFAAAEKFFYEPDGYRIKSLRNVFDKVAGVGKCSLFIPEYLNRSGCYDINGNSDVIKALIEVLIQRETVRKGTSDPQALIREKAEAPITPAESVMMKEGSLFPTADLRDIVADIIPNLQKFVMPHYVGRLIVNNDGVIDFSPNPELLPIRDYPLKDLVNKEGAVEIFEQPFRGHDGKTLPLRYIGSIDSIDDDYSSTDSLASLFIFDRYTDRIVAEYTGRPRTAGEFYEIARRLLTYYGATCNYENDKKGLFAYFTNHFCTHLLCKTPTFLKQMDYVKGEPYGNKAFGTNSSAQINALGRRLQADWLISPAYGEEETGLLNMHKIRSVGYLKELIQWNKDGNFDRVSSMGMLMIYREELAKFEVTKQVTKGSTLANDPFWNKFSKSHGGQGTTILNRLKNNPGFIPQSGFGYNN